MSGGADTLFLVFVLGGDDFAVPILRVREIIELCPATRVPSVPPCVAGLINVRGAVVPLIDLGKKFGFAMAPTTRTSCVVILEASWGGQLTALGVLVDEVKDVATIEDEDIEPPLAAGARIRIDFLRGVGKLASGLALVLDIDRVLSPEEILAVSELGERGAAEPSVPPVAAP
jgi:purine-binding chemotaxis protein CheW